MDPLVAELLSRERVPFSQARELRSSCVTATDFPVLFLKNKYRSLKQLVYDKHERTEPKVNPAMAHGVHYEAQALKAYTQATGNQLVEEHIGFVRSKDYPWVGCTPDAVCKFLPILVEIKCPYWREIQPHCVPDLYIDQLQAQMFVTGLKVVHFVQFRPQTLVSAYVLSIQTVEYDPTWWDRALPLAKRLHALLKIDPPPKRKKEYTQKKLSFLFVD